MKAFALIAALLLQTPAPAPQPGRGVIAGRILFSDGTPAPNTPIILVPVGLAPNTPRTIRSDAAGQYSAANVAPGRYQLRVAVLGGTFIYYPGVTNETTATIVSVAADSTTDGLNFPLPASASGVRVFGRVKFPDNESVKPGTITVRMTGTILPAPVTIAADGTFEFTHIRPGNYSVIPASPGAQGVRVDVADRDVPGIQLIIPPLATVSVAIAMESGAPRPSLTGLALNLEEPTGRTRLVAQPDGTFSGQVPQGEYRPTMMPMPTGYYLKSLVRGSEDLFVNALKITGTEGPIQLVATFGRSPGVKLSGRVKDSGTEQTAPANSKILFVNPVTNELAEVSINPNRTFEVPKIMPGYYLSRAALTSTMAAPFTPLTIPNKDVQDFEVTVPGLKEITGRVAVAGNGPSPRFTLMLVRGAIELTSIGPNEMPQMGSTQAALARTLTTGNQILQLNFNPLPDGTFRVKLPEGTYRVASGTMPEPYFVRSVSYGPARLTSEPLIISSKDSEEIHIGLGTKESNPWVKVAGKVTGVDISQGPFRVTLEGGSLATLETHLNTDGTFEFPSVLHRTAYTARLVPASNAVPTPRVTVADKDVVDVQIPVPPEKEVTIRVSTEANTPIPGFVLQLVNSLNTMRLVVKPDRDGLFKAKLPADERRVILTGLPLGYEAKTLAYGDTNILTQSLKIASTDSMEIRIGIVVDPKFPMGSLRGRVTGLDPERRNTRILLHGVSSFSTFDLALNTDGSFNFPRIPLGTYLAVLEGEGVAADLTPRSIVVSSSNLTGIEFAAPKQGAQPPVRPLAADTATGATVSDLGGGSREDANESASVGNLRTVNAALMVYLSSHNGNYGGMQDLIAAGLLDPSFLAQRSGYVYSIIAVGSTYAAASLPVSPDVGRFGYYITPDAVVRYVTADPLAPRGLAGTPIQ